MKCNEFEQRLADAWGNELAESDRAAFEAHARDCASCRQMYEGGQSAVDLMRSLDGPRKVSARREQNRLVLEWSDNAASRTEKPDRTLSMRSDAVESEQASGWTSSLPWFLRSAFRHAAALLIAFTAGYMFHAGLMLFDARREAVIELPSTPIAAAIEERPSTRGVTLHTALANAYTRSPGSSDLAKALMALSRTHE